MRRAIYEPEIEILTLVRNAASLLLIAVPRQENFERSCLIARHGAEFILGGWLAAFSALRVLDGLDVVDRYSV